MIIRKVTLTYSNRRLRLLTLHSIGKFDLMRRLTVEMKQNTADRISTRLVPLEDLVEEMTCWNSIVVFVENELHDLLACNY